MGNADAIDQFATLPSSVPNVLPADWWLALLVMGYMTGWRIGQRLSRKWSDIDLASGEAIAEAEACGNKGNRNERNSFHRVVAQHLEKLIGLFDEIVFPRDMRKPALWTEFQLIQETSEIPSGARTPKEGRQGGRQGFPRPMSWIRDGESVRIAGLDATKVVGDGSHLRHDVERLFVPPNLLSEDAG